MIKEKIRKYILKKVYDITTADDIVTITNFGDIYVGDNKLEKHERRTLIEEAKLMEDFKVFGLLRKNRLIAAQKKVAIEGAKFIPNLQAVQLMNVEDTQLISALAALDPMK